MKPCSRAGPAAGLLALPCKREGTTLEAESNRLPPGLTGGEVMFQELRKVAVKDSAFQNWLGPFDVYVYRFRRP